MANLANLTEEDFIKIEERMNGMRPLRHNNSPKASKRLRHSVTHCTALAMDEERRAELRRVEEKLKEAPGSFRRHYHRQLHKALKSGAPIPAIVG